MCKLQKGQSILEFAIVLPLFTLILVGILYASMTLADYLSLSSMARSSAREASVVQDKNQVEKKYPEVKEKYKDYKFPVDIYKWDPKKNFNIEYKKNTHNVTVTIKAELNEDGSMLANIVNGLANSTNSNFNLNITYTMYSEYTPK